MWNKVGLLTLALFVVAERSFAGHWELSANGSYYKYDNGIIADDPSSTTIRKYGAGISYAFLGNTAVELSYSDTKNTEIFSQLSSAETEKWTLNRVTNIKNISIDLVVGFSQRRAKFRPYVRGGGGYTIRTTSTTGTEFDLIGDTQSALSLEAESQSVTAQVGTGFKYFIADRIALEFSYTIFASELDQPQIYLHHALAAGLRVVF